jgi:hypothetical protein
VKVAANQVSFPDLQIGIDEENKQTFVEALVPRLCHRHALGTTDSTTGENLGWLFLHAERQRNHRKEALV